MRNAKCLNLDEQKKILESISELEGGADGLNEKVRTLLKGKMEIEVLGEDGAKKTAKALKGSRLTAL